MEATRDNNFDLLRIVAALQVTLVHANEHLKLHSQVIDVLQIFPGFPIFFVISGFLVSASYERSSLRAYWLNRAVRIFPGLWACLAVSILVAALWGVSFANSETLPWLAAQLSIAQFYNPDFLRGFGTGVLNGSLWTIPVELQFYIALPVIYAALRSRGALLIAIAVLIVVNQAYVNRDSDGIAMKLIGVSVVPYLYMFLLGVLLQRNREFIGRVLAGRAVIWLVAYTAASGAMAAIGLRVTGNYLNPLSAILLALTTIAIAYSHPIRLPHDLSYGLYLYHMVVINVLVETGATGSYAWLSISILISMLLAYASWIWVERPALKLRRRSTAKVEVPA